MVPPRVACLVLALPLWLAGCICGSFEGYLPGNDRHYTGREICGAGFGAFGDVGAINTNQFALHMHPDVDGSQERQEEINGYHLVTYMRRDEMVEGAFPELDPWGVVSGANASGGEIEVLDYELEERDTGTGIVLRTARYRLRWDLTWGSDEEGEPYLRCEATDWVEASL